MEYCKKCDSKMKFDIGGYVVQGQIEKKSWICPICEQGSNRRNRNKMNPKNIARHILKSERHQRAVKLVGKDINIEREPKFVENWEGNKSNRNFSKLKPLAQDKELNKISKNTGLYPTETYNKRREQRHPYQKVPKKPEKKKEEPKIPEEKKEIKKKSNKIIIPESKKTVENNNLLNIVQSSKPVSLPPALANISMPAIQNIRSLSKRILAIKN